MSSDDKTAELKQERARRLLEKTGLFSKSADSDTLIVELIRDHLSSQKEVDNGLTSENDGIEMAQTVNDEENGEIDKTEEKDEDVSSDKGTKLEEIEIHRTSL